MSKGNRRRHRATGEIDKLPPEIRDAVDQMLLSGKSYREIVEYLSENNVGLSQMTVCRYARRYLASVEEIKMSRENVRMMLEEMDKYPNVDTTEAILRMASQNVYDVISSLPKERWETIEPDKLLRESTALIRAAGHKRQIDQRMKSDTDKALSANQTLLFDVLSKKHPELYEQVMHVIREESS